MLSFPLLRKNRFWWLLLLAAFIISIVIWIIHAPRFFIFNSTQYGDHWNHGPWLLLHVGAATLPLFIGPYLLISGSLRYRLPLHRLLGKLYLVLGTAGVMGGIAISIIAPHEPRGLFVATLVLGLVWLGAAFMAYRAILNKRIESHKEWMIRSYILTFSFAACRVVMRTDVATSLGTEGITTVVWSAWVIPLFITEMILQWKKGKEAPMQKK